VKRHKRDFETERRFRLRQRSMRPRLSIRPTTPAVHETRYGGGFVTASVNATLAVQTAVIAAKSLGIDSLITNGIHRGDMERVWKLLDLPQTYCFPLIAVVLGYPTSEPTHLKGRLDGPGVIHHEKYRRLTEAQLEEQVRQYDDPERHLALDEGWKAKGYEHFMDWWFKDWLRGAKPTEKETQMLRLLKRSGFVELRRS
jgi:hypothetical protein